MQAVADKIIGSHNRGTRIIFRIASDLMRNKTNEELKARVAEVMKSWKMDPPRPVQVVDSAGVTKDEFHAYKQKVGSALAGIQKQLDNLKTKE